MFNHELNLVDADTNLELMYAHDSLRIFSVPQNSLRKYERAQAYSKRFPNLDCSKLEAYDSTSMHFEVWEGANCIGGFRLSQIGDSKSEIEEVFVGFRFLSGSVELGRLWVSNQQRGYGRRCTAVIYEWLGAINIPFYLKTSAGLGEIAKAHGAHVEGVRRWNPRLEYEVELLSLGASSCG